MLLPIEIIELERFQERLADRAGISFALPTHAARVSALLAKIDVVLGDLSDAAVGVPHKASRLASGGGVHSVRPRRPFSGKVRGAKTFIHEHADSL